MKLTLKRAKRLLEAQDLRQSALVLCDTPEEARDLVVAACCWLAHVDLQATPQSMAELEKIYSETQIQPVDKDDNSEDYFG